MVELVLGSKPGFRASTLNRINYNEDFSIRSGTTKLLINLKKARIKCERYDMMEQLHTRKAANATIMLMLEELLKSGKVSEEC